MSNTRADVLNYYRGYEDAVKRFAYHYKGRNKIVGSPTPQNNECPTLLCEALERIREAKTLALSLAEKPELDRFAIIEGQPNDNGTVFAKVRSFSDPTKTYRVSYHAKSTRMHCECESFNRLNMRYSGFPFAGQTERLCKHCITFLPDLMEAVR